MELERSKTKILIFGGTGYMGKYMVNASLLLGHPTFVYSRPVGGTVNSSKIDLLNDFHSKGATVVHGELDEKEKIVSLLKQVDVVISTLPYPQVLQQLKIIDAIKIAGNIKRFFPSDFGSEEDKIRPLPPFQRFLDKKKQIRRATEASGIPYTFVSANAFAAYFVNYLLHPHDAQLNEIHVYGTGQAKAVLNYEEDIAMYTIKAANDPRTRNRIIIYRPTENAISQLELISLWETKTGRSFNKVFITEEEIVKLSQTLPDPQNIQASILHSIFIRGDTACFEIGNDYVEASQLYPDVKLTSIHHLLDIFLVNPIKPAIAAF